ncbi:MAG: phosphonate degradation associated HDIG domain protein [Candidatus Latescibacterota bacterium]|jgi:phosphonate degradation associated HDIG domain protein
MIGVIMDSVIDEVLDAFHRNGGALYDGGEAVTQLQHALQTAYFIAQGGASDTLIAAALLHDFGHVMDGEADDLNSRDVDGKHEEIGAKFLSQHFVPAVTEPGRLHVAAKRYLCAVDKDYFGQLSPVSVRSLELQGGPFTPAQVNAFERNPHHQDAVRLRRCDEMGKDPNLETPDLEYYRSVLEAGLKVDA